MFTFHSHALPLLGSLERGWGGQPTNRKLIYSRLIPTENVNEPSFCRSDGSRPSSFRLPIAPHSSRGDNAKSGAIGIHRESLGAIGTKNNFSRPLTIQRLRSGKDAFH